jgi:uncharacterized glyoxalase superfamily protein PhnB
VAARRRLRPRAAEIFRELAGARRSEIHSLYRDVLTATVRYADNDFAALNLQGLDFMLHADHTYDHHPLFARLKAGALRGTGAEIRVLGIDPDTTQLRAETAGAKILQSAMDFPHGWRDVMLEDPDGYIWAVGIAIP